MEREGGEGMEWVGISIILCKAVMPRYLHVEQYGLTLLVSISKYQSRNGQCFVK